MANKSSQNREFFQYLKAIQNVEEKIGDPEVTRKRYQKVGISYKDRIMIFNAPFSELENYFMERCKYPHGSRDDLELMLSRNRFKNAGIPESQSRMFYGRKTEIVLELPKQIIFMGMSEEYTTKIKERYNDYNLSVGFWSNGNNDGFFGDSIEEEIIKEIVGLCEFGTQHHYRICLPFAKPRPVFYDPVLEKKRNLRKN
jgi:hypothetical protein